MARTRVPNLFLDVSRRRVSSVSSSSSVPGGADEWLTGRVTEVLAGGWLEVELPADDPQTVATGPSDGGVTQVGAIVRVLRDSSGRITQIASPTEVDTSEDATPVVSMGATGDMIASAMSDAADALAGLSKAAQDAAAAQSAANSAAQSATDALKAAENAGAPAVFATDAPTDPADGQTWYVLNSDGQVIGVNEWVAASSSWVPRPILAGSVIVPGSVGSTLIADGAVTTPKVDTDDLWATFVRSKGVTTNMLTAGNATITDSMIVSNLTGKTITGGKLVAGDSASAVATVGPVATGTFGMDITSAKNGSAELAVKSTGPYLQFQDSRGAETFYVDGSGNFRMKDRVRGGTVSLDNYLTSWNFSNDFGQWYFPTHQDWSWEFFLGTQFRVMSPTGKLRMEHRLMYEEAGSVGAAIDIQMGLYTADPSSQSSIGTNLFGSVAYGLFSARIGANIPSFTGAEIVDVTPNAWYWVRAIWRRQAAKGGTIRLARYWSQVQPV